jgi:hypothetical protein
VKSGGGIASQGLSLLKEAFPALEVRNIS